MTRVTRRRDGFRNRPDGAFEKGLWRFAAVGGKWREGRCEQSPQSSTFADEFLRAESRNVAIFSYVAWPAKAHVGLRC